MRKISGRSAGFTLIEILVVVAIIAVLVALLFPVLEHAMEKSRISSCMSNQRQLAASIVMWVQDHNEVLPADGEFWSGLSVASDKKVMLCPSADENMSNCYAFNKVLYGVAFGDIANPEKTALTCDGKNGLPEGRHAGKLVSAFVDGHVEWRGAVGVFAGMNLADGAQYVYMTNCTFLMGDDPSDAMARHQVTITKGYYIYRDEVTVGQYQKFCSMTGRAMPDPPAYFTSWAGHETYPMVNVTYNDAKDYATWAGASLPTEAQWEAAVRGLDERSYPWGGEWNDAYCVNSVPEYLDSPMPVGSKERDVTPCGARDMAGNVSEWCLDWFDPAYYGTSPAQDPVGPATGFARAVRGGSFFTDDPGYFRGATRNSVVPTDYQDDLGFRCVLSTDTAAGP